MSVECVDAAGETTEDFENWGDDCGTAILNGREITVLNQWIDQKLYNKSLLAQAILQKISFEEKAFLHEVKIITDLDAALPDEEPMFEFASCSPMYNDLTFADASLDQLQIMLCKGFFHKAWDKIKKGAKKAAKAIEKILIPSTDPAKKAAEQISHATNKCAEKVAEFVKEHKKEILITAAIVAAILGAYYISGCCGASAAAVGDGAPPPNANRPKRKEEEGDQEPFSAGPPPEPLPDWAKDILNISAPGFSFANSSEAQIVTAQKEAHDAWNQLNNLKIETEGSLAHLKSVQPEFDPSFYAVNTILNTIMTDPQIPREFFTSTNWHEIIRSGHEKIDQTFSAALAAKVAPPPQLPAPNFMERVQLGLEIIGRGMSAPDRLDPNMPVDLFIRNETEKKTVPPQINQYLLADQTIGNFIEKITETFKDPVALRKAFDSYTLGQVTSLLELGFRANMAINNEIANTVTSLFGSEKSRYYKTEGFSRVDMLITFVNGMDNTYEYAVESAKHIKALFPNAPCIEGVYNHSNGKIGDLSEIISCNFIGASPNTADLLAQKWTDFHEKNKDRPDAKILHFCHSQGAFHTKNAITSLPQEIRDRIIVVAIAPATVVSKDWCFDSFNYASKKDMVPTLGFWLECLVAYNPERNTDEVVDNLLKIQNELTRLDPDEKPDGRFDHGIRSPTFNRVILEALTEYVMREGRY